jgi:hypothetical protein
MTEKEAKQPVEEPREEEKKEPSPLEESKQILAGLKQQNEILQKNIKEAQELAAENLLSGRAVGGVPSKTAEEKAIDNARAMLAGSGYEDDLFPK